MKYIFWVLALVFALLVIFQLSPTGMGSQDAVDGFLETQSIRTSKLPLRTKAEIIEAQQEVKLQSSLPIALTFPIKFENTKLYISSAINQIDAIRGGRTHSGTDFSYHQGSVGERNLEIVSATSGKVVSVRRTDKDSCGINVIVQEQTTNLRYVYCHLRDGTIPDKIQEGVEVAEGEKLGIMGTTGNSSGVHLHFGIMKVSATSADFLDGVVVDGKYLDALDKRFFYYKKDTAPDSTMLAWEADGDPRELPVK